MATHNSISILMVEDQEVNRLGLRMVLDKFTDFSIVDEAYDGHAAVSKALALQPHLVLMDIGLPGIDGIEASRQIKSGLPATKILMLTNSGRDDDIFAALAAGADGYCLKDAAVDQLAMAIRAVSAGVAWLDPAIAQRVLHSCKQDGSNQSSGSRAVDRSKFALSAREMEVLALIVEGLSNPEIAARLVLSPETVKTHVRHIMEKLMVSDRTQAAVKALRDGLLSSTAGNNS